MNTINEAILVLRIAITMCVVWWIANIINISMEYIQGEDNV